MLKELPEVAKSFTDNCTKCGGEKYHRVLSHVDEKSAKVQCEICGKKKTFKLPSEKKKAVKKAKTTRSAQPAGGDWRTLLDSLAAKNSKPYSVREKFNVNDKIEHPKFGLGVVTNVSGDRLQTVFEDGEKTLIHMRA